MRKLLLLAGVAALTLSVPAIAKDNDRGRGRGDGHHASERHQGGGHGRAERARGRDDGPRIHRSRGEHHAERHGRGRDDRAERRWRGRDDRADRRLSRQERRVERAISDERRLVREARRGARRDDWRWGERERRFARGERFDDDRRHWRGDRGRRFAGGWRDCPPGLARQNRYCLPPGQLRRAHHIGHRLPIASWRYNVPDRYRYRFVDGDRWFYRYDDIGSVYRFDRGSGLVDAVVPLFATDLIVGEPLPLGYEVYNVPLAYRGYYPDVADYSYRYDDGAIYRIDPETMLVEGIVALLTGGGLGGLGSLGVGDLLPAGYDAYNVPFDYRDRYADSDEAWYRYADGSIYEVDPETRLIEQVFSLIA